MTEQKQKISNFCAHMVGFCRSGHISDFPTETLTTQLLCMIFILVELESSLVCTEK